MAAFSLEIVERPVVRTAGYYVQTTMDNASRDCPALWNDRLGPAMASFPADPAYPDQSFGVSVMDCGSDDAFTYWAVMPLEPGAPAPEGMTELSLPGGLYVQCRLAGLAELGKAYMYIYTEWPNNQDEYAVNMDAPSIELYTSDFIRTGELAICCPIIEK